MKPPRYPIRAVSRLTGLSVDTLRAWERRHRAVEPGRDPRGRLYSPSDVERLLLLRGAVQAGHAIGRLAALSNEELRELAGPGAPPRPFDGPAGPVDLAALQEAVERFDAAGLRRELTRLAAVLPPHALAREVALPFLQLVGEAWHEGNLGVAQEHLVSAELRSLVGGLARLHTPAEGAPRLLLSTPESERHELGTLAAALVAAHLGFDALYLGPSMPAAELASAARRLRPRALVLGYGGRGGAPEGLRSLEELALALPAPMQLWVGGAGVRELDGAALPRARLLPDFDAYEAALGAELRARPRG